jgi:DNA-directed RNA polymerase subunit RPC12/RpoP
MSDRFISLNCANCGAKLEVYDDMDRFACGYCGTEMLVQRRGGTVALKAVTEAIQKVQVGTDKTAAELALVRLNEELKALQQTKILVQGDPKYSKFGCLGFVGMMAPIFFIESLGSAMFVLMLPGLAVLIWTITGLTRTKDENRRKFALRVAELDRQIAENRRIVDG